MYILEFQSDSLRFVEVSFFGGWVCSLRKIFLRSKRCSNTYLILKNKKMWKCCSYKHTHNYYGYSLSNRLNTAHKTFCDSVQCNLLILKCNRWKYSPSSFSIVTCMPFEILSKTKKMKILLWKVIKIRWFWNFGLSDLKNNL